MWLDWFEPMNILFGAIITSLGGVLVSVVTQSAKDTRMRLEENARKMDAIKRISLTGARKDLRRACEFYVVGNRPIPESIFQELREEHESYTAVGGNGTEPKWWAAIDEKGAATPKEIALWLEEHPGESLSY